MKNKGFDRDLAVQMHEFLWFGTFYPDEPCYSLCLKQDSFAWGGPIFFYLEEPCYSSGLVHFIRMNLVIPCV